MSFDDDLDGPSGLYADDDDQAQEAYEAEQEKAFVEKVRYTITCFPCCERLMTDHLDRVVEFGQEHKECTFEDPALPPGVARSWQDRAANHLRQAVELARKNVTTNPDHAGYPNHYANDRIRDLFEEAIHE